ncbi:phage minor capsid protein [Nonomuraea sp. NPDC047529]|uniref:phage minor capsid protein n=1 Tax=Nonomuraea sp. NPDC047529 TaxID=3155623 RepID=UPI0033D0ECC2
MSERLVTKVARRGITGFTDSSGRVWSVTAYAEAAVRAAMAQAATDGHLATLAENGIDLVIVSRLPFTCPRCALWEGKILSQDGPIGFRQVESAVSDDMMDVLVEGTVAQARAAGLLHPGCGHTLSGYLPKRQAVVALDTEHRRKAGARVAALENRLTQLSHDAGMPRRGDRERI